MCHCDPRSSVTSPLRKPPMLSVTACNIADANSLQVITEHRLDGAFPAVGNVDRLRHPLVCLKPCASPARPGHRRRFHRAPPFAGLPVTRTCPVPSAMMARRSSTSSRQFLILLAQLANLLANVCQVTFEFVTRLTLAQFRAVSSSNYARSSSTLAPDFDSSSFLRRSAKALNA